MSFDLFLRVGGYWSKEDSYHGGEPVEVGKTVAGESFRMDFIRQIVVGQLGYEDNMCKISWFPPETPSKKEDIEDEETLSKVVNYVKGSGAMTLFVVREDDPYIGRHRNMGRSLHDDDDDDAGGFSSGDDAAGEGFDANIEDFDPDGSEIVVRVADETEDSWSDQEVSVVDDDAQSFRLEQQFSTLAAFKNAVISYAVKTRKDLKFEKSDSKRVVAICSGKKCPWRISASINSSSNRAVVRSYQDDHNCTWQGKVSLLTNSRIAEIYEEEFRINPNLSANQLQQKLLKRNINVAETICERTRLRCLQKFDDEQAESFARLFDYVEELKTTNPG